MKTKKRWFVVNTKIKDTQSQLLTLPTDKKVQIRVSWLNVEGKKTTTTTTTTAMEEPHGLEVVVIAVVEWSTDVSADF